MFKTSAGDDCKSPGAFSHTETPRKALPCGRRSRVGVLPELIALETFAESLELLKWPDADFDAHPNVELRALEFELNSNAKMTDIATVPVSAKSSKPPPRSSDKDSTTTIQTGQDTVIAEIVSLIKDLEARHHAAEEKRRSEKREQEKAKNEEAKEEAKKEEAKEEAKKEEAKEEAPAQVEAVAEETTVVPAEVKKALIGARAVNRISQSEEYRRFLQDPHPQIKAYRVAVGKAAGSVPNKLGNTMQRLAMVFESLENNRQQIMNPAADEALRQSGFDLAPFQTLMSSTSNLFVEDLSPMRDMTLLTFHFYFKLSSVLLDNAQQQMSRNPATMWTYAHFLALLWRKWDDAFKLIFLGVLHGRSNWAIPWPSQDSKIRKEASNEQLANWCRESAGCFALKMSLHVCLQDAPQCWRLLARLLNRLTEKYLTHPAVPFILADSFSAANHFLCSRYREQMAKVLTLLEMTLADRLLVISRMPESWKEVRVPTTQLLLLLAETKSKNMNTSPPIGYVLSAKEEDLNADL